jgi:UDP-N-acetyl-D-glucosamine/UDP-N-acetyl-D-galactosamine dehydrogenase
MTKDARNEKPAALTLAEVKIGIIGLGYVGLPLAAYMGRVFPVVGLDIDTRRIDELKKGHDRTREVSGDELSKAKKLKLTIDKADLKGCNFFIVTVPTPIDDAKRPDLTPLQRASETSTSRSSTNSHCCSSGSALKCARC